MDLNRFSIVNRQRCEAPDGFNHKLTDWSLSDWMTAIAGEAGEAANVVKKLNRVRDGIAGNSETEAELRAKLARELADVFIYLDLTFQRLGLDPSAVIAEVFNRKSEQIGSPLRA
jgi:NTP pyrophosphatase (non-canonical NTP hydrolase)